MMKFDGSEHLHFPICLVFPVKNHNYTCMAYSLPRRNNVLIVRYRRDVTLVTYLSSSILHVLS